ncbi:MAG: pyruvate, phosphate dikinase [Candidatus Sedimenticola endophacoides]|uniref:Pyruvate, phosphate dikinase n=3 Tax=Candidatus Sedimenticola endophacoides TaxID=2548426 RepID=A0A6N4DR83_9GAMM|nr:MAG: pyruvate, phosphate dikinase [Candidatus Sedimenticola endophacoides]OQX36449.1 MAG: pyruvate, phosphate dikinase [Candidatus Sedimenticola endophacoides]OQX41419.1 MAG: pyruvate, phosphate dikinase [Candidatus Sedimenticola endophacoides]PUD98691.1 MAG: pyruvate, phosphate dikinase [Candidatus Sedimenticola endophacoides]PUE00919.1 MAG: pyruvate, phosphate dikinase [Candidatus Sedimenticola endophacoides]
MSESNQYVFSFEEGDGKDKMLLGGKGANLCEMTQIGLNVPPGFVITTETCLAYLERPEQGLPAVVMEQVRAQMRALEEKTGKRFGGVDNPLLVSVRSGSAMSMPGMMDTILNLGLNRETLPGLIAQSNNERFAYDAYRRFIQLFGKVALGVADEAFDREFEGIKERVGAKEDIALSARDLREAAQRFLEVIEHETGSPFPDDPYQQLEIAIKAVFNSWMGRRAVDYRREFHITPAMANGTAVNIVTMVFGNLGDDSATGVGFTRYPDTGENRMFGEYLTNAQGEDVVAGIRTPRPIDALADEMPGQYRELVELRNRLERHYKEVQDFEFTIERGRLYCLQTRNGKMNATALVRTSVEMEREGLISREQALLRIQPQLLEQLLFPRLDPDATATPLARGLPASPGAAVGRAVFDADRAELEGHTGNQVILVREETKPEDIHGFFAAQGILTSRGGKTSHAAVVARGMGKPCVAGAEGIRVDVQMRKAFVGDATISEGDLITIDGTTGDVYLGEVAMKAAEFSSDLDTLLTWADQVARLRVMANADTPGDAAKAAGFGAQGIGLCRTERMFNAVERLPIVVEMILAEDDTRRQAALDKLLPIQRSDFKGMLKAMAGRQVTIRLLDPPIHEFLPSEGQLEEELSQLQHLRDTVLGMNILSDTVEFMYRIADTHPSIDRMADPRLVDEAIAKKAEMLNKVRALHEVNPMLGHRGVRLGITFPEIYAMQIRAVLEAAAECIREGLDVFPEIMVPQVCTKQELARVKGIVDSVQRAVEAHYGVTLHFKFGSMLEVVRACMRAESLAEVAEFFSFGTNDLTQAAFSFSREDAENKFLPMYNENGILQDNPFEVLDIKGVGKLMELAVQWGRNRREGMKMGICGEHGGHPESIRFCHQIGLSYVSCSAPRVPIARLAAAHAALGDMTGGTQSL